MIFNKNYSFGYLYSLDFIYSFEDSSISWAWNTGQDQMPLTREELEKDGSVSLNKSDSYLSYLILYKYINLWKKLI